MNESAMLNKTKRVLLNLLIPGISFIAQERIHAGILYFAIALILGFYTFGIGYLGMGLFASIRSNIITDKMDVTIATIILSIIIKWLLPISDFGSISNTCNVCQSPIGDLGRALNQDIAANCSLVCGANILLTATLAVALLYIAHELYKGTHSSQQL